MFRQQINLNKAFIKPKIVDSLLSFRRFWITNAIFLSLLFILYIGSLIELYYLNGQFKSLVIQNNLLEKQFENTKNQYPTLFFSQDIETNINHLEQSLASEEKILETISRKVDFSIYLEMFSQLIVPQTWLTSFSIDNQGSTVQLQGKSLTANGIQLFLNNLLAEKQLHDYTLNIKDIRHTTENEQHRFEFEINAVKKS